LIFLGAWNAPLTPRAASTDGSTLVGEAYYASLSTVNILPATWNAGAGYLLPALPPETNHGSFFGVSADGSVAVGGIYNSARASGPAVRWTAAAGLVSLGYLGVGTSGLPRSTAYALTPDGQIAVGGSTSNVQNYWHPFRWSEASGMVDLWPQVPGSGVANAVNADGSVAVGDYHLETSRPRAFIWDSARGGRDLRQVLLVAGAGSSLDLWTLTHAYGISADGLTIVGSGIDPQGRTQAYVARLPTVGLCYANCDNSTTAPRLNVNDFICFQQHFAAEDPYANCDGSTTDPVLNAGDFVCFLSQFAGGC
jgi:uncharacterized membrane protein